MEKVKCQSEPQMRGMFAFVWVVATWVAVTQTNAEGPSGICSLAFTQSFGVLMPTRVGLTYVYTSVVRC